MSINRESASNNLNIYNTLGYHVQRQLQDLTLGPLQNVLTRHPQPNTRPNFLRRLVRSSLYLIPIVLSHILSSPGREKVSDYLLWEYCSVGVWSVNSLGKNCHRTWIVAKSGPLNIYQNLPVNYKTQNNSS